MHLIKEMLHRIYSDIQSNRIFLLILLIYMVITQLLFHTVCPFAFLTGLPCPACGMTRAFILFLCGHFLDAAKMQPALYLWIPFLGYICFSRYILGKKPQFLQTLTVLTGLFTLLVYLYRFAFGTPVLVPQPGILPYVWNIFRPLLP